MHRRVSGRRSAAQLVMAGLVVAYVDGSAVTVDAGCSLLEACDAAGRYVPRLCFHPGAGSGCQEDACSACGLCLVRMADGAAVLACSTPVADGMRVSTDDPDLGSQRRRRLAAILARHPHVCLTCPEREGCTRDQCMYGHAPKTRCCDELGRCELGKVAAHVDPQVLIPRRPVAVSRTATVEGRIRYEPGLCVGCGRCVRLCATSPAAGSALELVEVAHPKRGTLRESGCTFCGLCVLACPSGALTCPGRAGARWLASRRMKHQLAAQVLPPQERPLTIADDMASLPSTAGVFTLLDGEGEVLWIAGVSDLLQGLAEALKDPASAAAVSFRFEVEPLYTQRETELLAQYARDHGHLPTGDDLGEDLFADDLD